jgi:hypothetical protein
MAKKKVKSDCAEKQKKSFQAGMNIGRNMKNTTPKKTK